MKSGCLKFLSAVVLASPFLFFNSPASAENEWEVVTNKERHSYTVHVYPKNGAYDSHKGYSHLYDDILPKAPIFQTYIPASHSHFRPQPHFYMHIPQSALPELPDAIRSEIAADGVAHGSVKIFAVGQSTPYGDGGWFTGFYPQYGTDPLAPHRGNYNTSRRVKAILAESDSKKVKFERIVNGEAVQIRNTEEGDAILKSMVPNKSSIVHPNRDSLVVVSPVPLGVSGLDRNSGQSLWSYVSYQEEGINKALVTLHLLFDDSQNRTIFKRLWGRRDVPENFGLLPSGAYTNTTAKLVNLFETLKEEPEFKGRGQHFQKLLSLIKETSIEVQPTISVIPTFVKAPIPVAQRDTKKVSPQVSRVKRIDEPSAAKKRVSRTSVTKKRPNRKASVVKQRAPKIGVTKSRAMSLRIVKQRTLRRTRITKKRVPTKGGARKARRSKNVKHKAARRK